MCSASLSLWFDSLCVWSGLTDAGACPLCLWGCHMSPWGGGGLRDLGSWVCCPVGMALPACCSSVECAGREGNAMEGFYLLRTLSACWHRSEAAHGWFWSGQRAACGPPLVPQSGLSVTVSPSLFPTPPGFVKGHKQVGDGDTLALLSLPPSITNCSRKHSHSALNMSTPKHNVHWYRQWVITLLGKFKSLSSYWFLIKWNPSP